MSNLYRTTGEVARSLGVGVNSVKRWISNGTLHGIRTPGGHWRIPVREFQRFAQAFNMDKPAGDDPVNLRILIADDDPSECTLLSAVLQHTISSCDVKSVHDGYSGLIQIGAWRPDILLLDILMPGIDGVEVLRQLHRNRELYAGMAIVVVTAAFDHPELMRDMKKNPPDAILAKPVDIRRLISIINGYLKNGVAAGKRHMAERVASRDD